MHPSDPRAQKSALRLLAKKSEQKRHNSPYEFDIPTILLPEESNWTDEANCRGLNHHMFPRRHKDISYITVARQICRDCPVKEECLDEALEYPPTDMHGVWAGLTPRQLAAEQKRRGIIPSKPTLAQIWNNFAKQEQKQ